jgi:RND family efflux transporter MFP subunit
MTAALALLGLFGVGCDTGGSADAVEERPAVVAAPDGVAALGRIEPKDGLIRVAGPSSRPAIVIAKLLVEEGDRVQAGQPLAELDTIAEDEARVAKARAELRNAEAERARLQPLLEQRIVADEARDRAQLRVDVARADLAGAQAALDQATLRGPVAGQIVEIHARRGERVGPEGFAEIAQNDTMYAVAEVYETDIGRVKAGMRASVRSPAFEHDLEGTVDQVGMKIGKQDLLAADPVARTDSRVVEVRVKLDEPDKAAALSNLQVEVVITP